MVFASSGLVQIQGIAVQRHDAVERKSAEEAEEQKQRKKSRKSNRILTLPLHLLLRWQRHPSFSAAGWPGPFSVAAE